MKKLLQKSYIAIIYFLLYFPIAVLMLFSVNNAHYSMQWHGFTLAWYKTLLQNDDIWTAFLHSVFLGLSTAAITTVIGLLACVHLFFNCNQKKPKVFYSLLLLIIIIPDLVLGVALLIFFNFTLIPLGFFSLLFAHITFCLPFVILIINSRIQTLDVNIYLSALDLGASHFKALVKIILPLLFPAILSGFLMAFTLSFDDIVISYFVAGPEFNILPLAVYSLVRTGVTPELNALCSFTLLISLLIAILAYHLSRKPT